jgi:hypothetical protein
MSAAAAARRRLAAGGVTKTLAAAARRRRRGTLLLKNDNQVIVLGEYSSCLLYDLYPLAGGYLSFIAAWFGTCSSESVGCKGSFYTIHSPIVV